MKNIDINEEKIEKDLREIKEEENKGRRKINILLTNDDGYQAAGINALGKELSKIANVTMLAPDRERSAIGHGLTFFHPLRVNPIEPQKGITRYISDGTPTDCVLLGLHDIMEVKPDLVVSGINRGPNLGDDVTYSGTVSAAMEGAIQGYPAMAVSLGSFQEADYSFAAEFAAWLAQRIVRTGLPDGVFLNVNVPAVPKEDIKGIEITFQGRSIYHQKIVRRSDPRGQSYFWITGAIPDGLPEPGTDFFAMKNNKISITPLHLSLTKRDSIEEMKKWDFFKNGIFFNE